MNLLYLVISGWGLVALVFALAWWHGVRTRNAGWVDFAWSFSLVLLLGWFAFWSGGLPWRRVFYLALTGLWGVRLAGFLFFRLQREGVEDPRYQYLRRHWGKRADARFFWFFQSQGVANLLLSAPILLLMQVTTPGLSVFDAAGLLIVLGSVLGESLADRQLADWKRDPNSRGKTCRRGLWAVSRHPNYFFEWLHWTAYPVLGLVLLGTAMVTWWPLTLLGPGMMLYLLLRVTGIPHTERRALESRGEDYRRYQREVSAFFPWFPRKTGTPD